MTSLPPRYRIVGLCCACLLVAARSATAVSLTLEQGLDGYTGFEDTSIFSENENSGGGTDGIFAGTNTQFDTRRALLRFDLSGIPSGSVINNVTLNLTVVMSADTFGDFDFTLHALNVDWGEGTVIGLSEGGFGATADPGDATWQSNFHATSAWSSPGGDFAAAPSATAAAGLAGTTATWSGAGLVSDVQAWVDNPATNHGWALVSAIEGQFKRVKKFDSSEAAADRPRVIIDYTPPAAASSLNHSALALLMTVIISFGWQCGTRRAARD